MITGQDILKDFNNSYGDIKNFLPVIKQNINRNNYLPGQNKIQKLGDRLLGGGSVSSYLLAEKGKIDSPIINDLDLFFDVYPYDSKYYGTKCNFPSRGTTILDHYCHVKSIDLYTVRSVDRIGIFNTVYCSMGWRNRNLFSNSILRGFDLNCCCSGIDLKTEELVILPHFNSFLNSNRIEYIRLDNPIHSYVRALKKSKDLNAFFDKEYYTTLTEVMYALECLSFYVSRATEVRWIFGADYQRKFNLLKNEISKDWILKDVPDKKGLKEFYNEKIFRNPLKYLVDKNFILDAEQLALDDKWNEFIEQKIISRYRIKEDKYKQIYYFIEKITGRYNKYNMLSLFPFFINRKKKWKSNLILSILKPKFIKKDSDKLEDDEWFKDYLAYNPDKTLGKNAFDVSILEKIDKYSNHRFSLGKVLNIMSLTESIKTLDIINKYEKKYGPMVWGLFEADHNSRFLDGVSGKFNQDLFKENIDYQLESKDDIMGIILPEELLQHDILVIKQLYTKILLDIEGKSMHNCVGGYSNSIMSNELIIFHVEYNINETKERGTLGLKLKTDNTLEKFNRSIYIYQFSGPNNISISSELNNLVKRWIRDNNEELVECFLNVPVKINMNNYKSIENEGGLAPF